LRNSGPVKLACDPPVSAKSFPGVHVKKDPYMIVLDKFIYYTSPTVANLGALIANMNSKLANFTMCGK